MLAFLVVTLVLVVAGCSEGPPPVTATRVLEVSGITPVVNAVTLSPDGSLVVVGDMEGNLVAREVAGGAERWSSAASARRGQPAAHAILFSPDGSLVARVTHDGATVTLWDAATGRPAATLPIANARGGLAFHPRERLLAIGAGPTVHVMEIDAGQSLRSLPNAHYGEAVYGVAFSGDGRSLASVSDQGSLAVWSWPDLTLRTTVALPRGLEALAPVSLTLSREGHRAAVNGLQGRTHVADLAKSRVLRTLDNAVEAPGHARRAEMRHSLAFTADGEWLFAPDTHDRGVRIVHVSSGRTYGVLRGEGPFYKAVAVSVPTSLVALLRPADGQGHGPYGLEVWRLEYRR
jgi:WD40 repeat protein